MASRSVFGMLGRKAAAVGVAGASVAANQPSAHAREAVHATAAPVPTARQVHDEDWLEPQFEGQEVLVFRSFRPEEVDQAVASVQAVLEQQQNKGASSKKQQQQQRVLALRPALTVEDEQGASAAAGPSHAPLATGPPSPAAETDSSYGEAATDVLAEPLVYATIRGSSAAATNEHQENDEVELSSVAMTGAAAAALSNSAMSDLLQISRKLLTRPGLQREVFKCMVEDPEVRDLMLRQSRNLDLYLQAAGIHTPAGLLNDASADHEGGSPVVAAAKLRLRLPASVRARVRPDGGALGQGAEEGEGEEEGEEGKDLLGKILDAVAACIDQTGSWLAGLGGWLKGRFQELGTLLGGAFGMGSSNPDEGTDDGGGARAAERGRSAADVVLGAVMVVTVALFCVMLARNPRMVAAAVAGGGSVALSKSKRQQAASA